MILRELFEAKAKSVGIIFGRFNPPHMGHMKAWEMASENSTWYVGTNKSTQGPKDPLPFDIKIKAMEAVYPEIKGHIVAEQSWLTLASKVYEKHGNIVLNVYTDEDWVTKAMIQYNGKEGAHGYYEFGTIQQQATPRLSSATALRNAVAADDRDLFGQAAGVDPNTLVAGHPFFDVVKHYLMPHAEKAAAKAVKKKVKEPVAELSSELLGRYKKAAGADAKKSDADGDYARGNKRFSGIVKATKKQFANDEKGVAEGSVDKKPYPKTWHDVDPKIGKLVDKMSPEEKVKKGYSNPSILKKKKEQGVAERARDPEDWDEGNTEPPNNFAVYINGKKWKVFKGRGQYADDAREQAHYQQLKDWAAKKSVSSGKQWTVSITGETATESLDEVSWKGIKQGAAAAGLAGAMALGAGGANADNTRRVTPDGQGGYTGGWKPTATVTAPSDTKPADAAPAAAGPTGFNKKYLQQAADPDRFGRYMISVEKAQELLKQMNSKVGEGSTFAGAKVGHKEGPAGQWRNDGAKKNKPARPGDLVGGGM